MSQVTDKLDHIMLHRVLLAMSEIELSTLVVVGNDCTGCCKSNYHAITNTAFQRTVCTLCIYIYVYIRERVQTKLGILCHSRFCATPDFVPLQILCHSRCCATPDFVPLQILCHSRLCATPDFVPLQMLCHSRFCATPDFVPLQILCHSRLCATPDFVPLQMLCHSRFSATPDFVPLQTASHGRFVRPVLVSLYVLCIDFF